MCHNQRIFTTLIREVGEWSADNFGRNISKYCGTTLDEVASLLGIIEEFGELEEALKADSPEMVRDAIGDIQIYLADYLYRAGLGAEYIDWREVSDCPLIGVFLSRENLIFLGQLAHINLKRHQGIRGYDGPKFDHELKAILTQLMIGLRLTYVQAHPKRPDPNEPLKPQVYTPQEATDIIVTIAASTWKHVQERNWKKDPQGGGQC